MRYMIDTRKISQRRPSPKEIAMNEWQTNELKIMGLTMPYDEGSHSLSNKAIKLTQFKSNKEHNEAMLLAFELLNNFQPVPEPLRTKLILEAENYRKHGRLTCI